MICKLANIAEVQDDKWYEYTVQTNSGLQSIMLIKNDQKLTAYLNSCPHQGRRMDYAQGQFLTDDLGHIICPAHGAEFTVEDGLCINGPCKGQSLVAVHVQINDEAIFAVI